MNEEELTNGGKLTREEIEYIETFLDDSEKYCVDDSDYEFDENVKRKLTAMKLGVEDI